MELLIFIVMTAVLLVTAYSAEEGILILFGLSVAVLLSISTYFGYIEAVWVLANPAIFIVLLALYMIIGILYVLLWRWPNFLHSRADSINRAYSEFLKLNKLQKDVANYKEFINSGLYVIYSAGHNKQRILAWLLGWPLCASWELSHKPIRWLYNKLYAGISTALTNISIRITSKIIK